MKPEAEEEVNPQPKRAKTAASAKGKAKAAAADDGVSLTNTNMWLAHPFRLVLNQIPCDNCARQHGYRKWAFTCIHPPFGDDKGKESARIGACWDCRVHKKVTCEWTGGPQLGWGIGAMDKICEVCESILDAVYELVIEEGIRDHLIAHQQRVSTMLDRATIVESPPEETKAPKKKTKSEGGAVVEEFEQGSSTSKRGGGSGRA